MNKLTNKLTNGRRTNWTVPSAFLLGILAIGLAVTPAVPLAAAGVSAVPATAAGLGFWAALGCMGCVGGFVIGGGLTVVGLAVVLAANPELGIACVAACVAAY